MLGVNRLRLSRLFRRRASPTHVYGWATGGTGKEEQHQLPLVKIPEVSRGPLEQEEEIDDFESVIGLRDNDGGTLLDAELGAQRSTHRGRFEQKDASVAAFMVKKTAWIGGINFAALRMTVY